VDQICVEITGPTGSLRGGNQQAGVSCSASVCVDDPTKAPEALDLYSEAIGFVGREIAPLSEHPRMIFCSTQGCADYFGLGARAAVTVGVFGTVIGPRAWKPYFIRHELIHQLQGERFGVLRVLTLPSWFVEGMAYSLSRDPRIPLAEPWDTDRRRFEAWNASVEKGQFWTEASSLPLIAQ